MQRSQRQPVKRFYFPGESTLHKLTAKLKNYNGAEARMNDDVHGGEKDGALGTMFD